MSECVVRMDIDEMPTACGPCELSCTAICKEWTKVDRKEIGRTKSPNCPILAILPEGHGRLVDADAYRAEMKDRQDAAWKWRKEAIAEEDEFKLARAEGAYTAFVEAKLTWDKQVTIVPAEAERSET